MTMIMASSYLRFLVLHLLDHETADDLHKFVAVDLLRRSKVDHRSSELDKEVIMTPMSHETDSSGVPA